MSRLLAGLLETGGAGTSVRWRALGENRASVLARGPLRVAVDRPELARLQEPLVVLDGVLDNTRELAEALRCPHTDEERVIAHGYRRLGP